MWRLFAARLLYMTLGWKVSADLVWTRISDVFQLYRGDRNYHIDCTSSWNHLTNKSCPCHSNWVQL